MASIPPLVFPLGAIAIDKIAGDHSDVVSDFEVLDVVATASTFGGLLLVPELQSNCLRLELLVHLAVAYCSGKEHPSAASIKRAFKDLGEGFCGRAEDPPEDVFVSVVNNKHGNYRILQGLRESPGFLLQRLLNVIETMPEEASFRRIRAAVNSMLRLSEAVVGRARLTENVAANDVRHRTLSQRFANRLPSLRSLLRFSESDLNEINLTLADLADFVLGPTDNLLSPAPGHGNSALERRPILVRGDNLFVVLPTAISAAITRYLAESILRLNLRPNFERAFVREIASVVSKSSIVAEPAVAHLPFQQFAGGWASACQSEVDAGRFVHLLLYIDCLEAFEQTGLAGTNAAPESLAEWIDAYIRRSIAASEADPDFREAVVLIVVEGLGRTIRFPLRTEYPTPWRVQMISAADLVTLGFMHEFDWLKLWRLLNAKRTVEAQGVTFVNVNGLLNLAAWTDQLDGHLLPHKPTPPEIDARAHKLIALPQDALKDVRQSTAQLHGEWRVLDVSGEWLLVRHIGSSPFREDDIIPLYVSLSHLEDGHLKGVCAFRGRPWWLTLSASDDSPREVVYDYWLMLCTWFRRAVPVLDAAYDQLPRSALQLAFRFGEISSAWQHTDILMDDGTIDSLVRVEAHPGEATAGIQVAEGLQGVFHHPENIAERRVVKAIVEAVAILSSDQEPLKLARTVSAICPNAEARHIHSFQAQNLRDHFMRALSRRPTIIDKIDSGTCRIGVGWRNRRAADGNEIQGVEQCTTYLNATVRSMIDDVRQQLSAFSRRAFVEAVLLNYECAAFDRERWRRTSQAAIALRRDRALATSVIIDHESQLNPVFICSRILIEAALCECPISGQYRCGKIDLSSLMARVSMTFHLGGFSDGIHRGVVEPHIRISELGDIQIDHDFFDSVFQRFGVVGSEVRLADAAESYAELYEEVDGVTDSEKLITVRFTEAFREEFGIGVDELRSFLDCLEDTALDRASPILLLKHSELLHLLAESCSLSSERAAQAIAFLTLSPRPNWTIAPTGFVDKDWQPWRFRRRLSLLRRPFVQIDEATDPQFIVAPAMAREAVAHSVAEYHSGEVIEAQARSRKMRQWLGFAKDRDGLAFNTTVAQRLRELGWQTDQEVALTKLLGRALEKDYGDIDVIAWSPESGRVLLIECKDLHYKKTIGEVAEQLSDYRGELKSDGKPDDLKKHLDRVHIVRNNVNRLSHYLSLQVAPQIEGHLVFKNPVPMRFAWKHMAGKISLSFFDELDRL